MNVTIYCLVDPRTSEIRYVGKAINPGKRFYAHVLVHRSNTHKSAWIRQMLKDGIRPILEVLEVIENSNDQDWQEVEKFWINYLRFIGCRLTNQFTGGHGGRKASPETREKLRVAMIEFYRKNPQERSKRSRESSGRKHSLETIHKMRKAQSFRSPQTRKRMSESAKKRGIPPDQIKKFLAAGQIACRTPEAMAKRSVSIKASWVKRKERKGICVSHP